MSEQDKPTLPVVTKQFKSDEVREFIVNKIKELNKDIPVDFDWNDFDISVKVYIGDKSYLQDKKMIFILRMKEEPSIAEKYKNRRISFPEEGIEFTSNLITLNKVLDDLGFNKVFHIDQINDIRTLLDTKLNLNKVITEDNSSGEMRFYISGKKMDSNNNEYVFTLGDRQRDEDFDSTQYYDSLLSIMNTRENGSELIGYRIRFIDNPNPVSPPKPMDLEEPEV